MLRRFLLALAIVTVPVVPASALQITMTFTATGFGAGAPEDPVSGVITWEAASVNATIDALTSVDLAIDGHVYALAEVSFISPFLGDTDIIGGTVTGVGSATEGTDDFWIRWNRVTGQPQDLLYTTSGVLDTFQTFTFTVFTITAAISEPVGLAVLAFGLVGFGLMRRRAVA